MVEGEAPGRQPVHPAVLVVGSLHYDIAVEASDRPRKGETLAGHAWRPKYGGKGGNQAVACRREGVATAMVGAVGRDAFGAALLGNLEREGVEHAGVAIIEGVSSGMSVAIFDSEGDYGAVIVSGANLHIRAHQVPPSVWSSARLLVLQNEIPETVNAELAARARQAGLLTILNAAPARPFETALPEIVDILIVNAIEAEMYGGGAVNSLASARAAAAQLSTCFQTVVVTAGANGVAFCDRFHRRFELPAIPVEVVSTHGAGDAFVGTMVAHLARGDEIEEAVQAANRAAASLVAKAATDMTQR
jgi:ribokinase